jgi:hypothetical protein
MIESYNSTFYYNILYTMYLKCTNADINEVKYTSQIIKNQKVSPNYCVHYDSIDVYTHFL